MRSILLWITVAIGLFGTAGCTPAEPSSTANPTAPTLEGQVEITFPQSGAIIYSETLYLRGTASDVPEEGFEIQVITPDNDVVGRSTIQPEEADWSVELVHGYSGDPTEVTIIAKPLDANNPLDYDIESVLLSTLANRPDGVFGEILSPETGLSVGGDSIPVYGRGSGLFENTFSLILETPAGEVIVETLVTMINPNFVDDMLWEAEIPRGDFVGNATLKMAYVDMESGEMMTLDEVEIVVSSVAG